MSEMDSIHLSLQFTQVFYFFMEYITLCLDSTNEVEQWYVRHKYLIVLYHRLHVLTYIQVIFRPSFTGKSTVTTVNMMGSQHV